REPSQPLTLISESRQITDSQKQSPRLCDSVKLEHFQEKWNPFFRPKMRPLQSSFRSFETKTARVWRSISSINCQVDDDRYVIGRLVPAAHGQVDRNAGQAVGRL